MKKIFLLPLLLLFVVSCEDEQDESPVTVFSDFVNTDVLYSNSVYQVNLQAFCNKGELASVGISTYDMERGVVHVWDTALSGQSFYHTYYYTAPELKKDSSFVRMTIYVSNTEGDVRYAVSSCCCVATDFPLLETAGVTLYGTESYIHPNGFCLQTLRPLMTSVADSSDVDIYAYVDSIGGDALSREWRTNTDLVFTRANNFDYANATKKSVTETFSSSIGNSRIADLQDDDVILIGRNNKAEGVIKIIQVIDDNGLEQDRYLFNIKKIQ